MVHMCSSAAVEVAARSTAGISRRAAKYGCAQIPLCMVPIIIPAANWGDWQL